MRKILTFFFALSCFAVSAQSDYGKTKLAQAMPVAELNALTTEEKQQLEFYATSGYRVHESGKSGQDYPLLSSALKAGIAAPDYAAISQENFNPLIFNFGDRAAHQFFVIDGTDRVVQIYEAGYCAMRYQQYKVTRDNAEKRTKK